MSSPLIDRPLELLFALIAWLRRGRALHPRGATYAARLVLEGEGPLPVGSHECTVRLSKGGGLPGPVPDALGVAVRVEVDGRPVDVLATTTLGMTGWRRLVPWPALTWGRAHLGSIMPLVDGRGRRAEVLLRADAPGLTTPDLRAAAAALPLRFVLQVVDRRDLLQRGELVVDGPEVPAVDLDPVRNAPPGWRITPAWLAAARVTAYEGSRKGRPDSRPETSAAGSRPHLVALPGGDPSRAAHRR